ETACSAVAVVGPFCHSKPFLGKPDCAAYAISFVAASPPFRCNLSLIQLSSHGIDAELLLRIHLKYPAHHLSFRFHHLVITRRGVALLHVVVAIRGPGKYIHHSLLRLVPFSAATPFCDLGTLIFRYHPLKLHHQLILGCA